MSYSINGLYKKKKKNRNAARTLYFLRKPFVEGQRCFVFFNLLELCLLVPFSDLNCVFLGFFTTLFSDASLELCVMPKDEDILQLVSFHLGANDFISLKNSRV